MIQLDRQSERAVLENIDHALGLGKRALVEDFGHLGDVDPALARLLRNTVTTGGVCRYDPDPDRPVRWLLEAPTAGTRPSPSRRPA